MSYQNTSIWRCNEYAASGYQSLLTGGAFKPIYHAQCAHDVDVPASAEHRTCMRFILILVLLEHAYVHTGVLHRQGEVS